MREILFRGKTKSGKWVEGGFHKHTKAIHCPLGATAGNAEDTVHLILRDGMADWELPVPIEGVEVIPKTVGQYTSLQDRNGRKIFEGDILYVGERTVYGIVRFGAYSHFMESTDYGFFLEWTEELLLRKDIGFWNKKAEVIGNIWDTPELLEAAHE